MLQIYTDGQLTDLPDDISIDLVFENPIFNTERIPATYSLSYELPLTPRNRAIFGHPDRVAAAGDRFRDHPTRIMHSGIEIASGVQTIEEVTAQAITVNFSGSVLPECIDKKMYKAPLGEVVLSYYLNGQDSEQIAITDYDGKLRGNQTAENPAFVACPIAIKDSGEVNERDPDNPEDTFLTTRKSFLNLVDSQLNYIHTQPGTGGKSYMLKILPAVKVWYLFEQIFGDKLDRNVFKEGEWTKLCLQTLWHPEYRLTDNLPPWRSEMQDGINKKIIRWADFMPDVTVADFVVEMLKLPGCTMFIRGDRFSVEYNDDILKREVYHNLQLTDGYTISREPGQKYVLGYSNASDGEQADAEIREAASVVDGLRYMDGSTYISAFRSRCPPQVLQADSESVPHLTVVKAYQAEEATEENDEDETSTYDMTIQAEVVQCNVRRWWYDDTDLDNSILERFYVPEIEKVETKRSDTILLGLYQGIQNAIRYQGSTWHYPYLASTNYNAYGERLGDLSLDIDTLSGLAKLHKGFKAWIEKDKLSVTGNAIFSALDLHNLDLRDKYCTLGRRFLIRTMNVSLKKNRIEPAEVELVEA